MDIKKLTVGVSPATKVFSVGSEWGRIADIVIERTADKLRTPSFFNTVRRGENPAGMVLQNEDMGTTLVTTTDTITYTRNRYGQDGPVNLEKFFEEFHCLWDAITTVVKFSAIRRLGIVGEHRISGLEKPSRELLNVISPLKPVGHPAKFVFSFEDRIPTAGMAAPDLENSDFINVIRTIYDSEMDGEEPEKQAINLNIDVQRYFNPSLTRNISDELRQVRRSFDTHRDNFIKTVSGLGLVAHGKN